MNFKAINLMWRSSYAKPRYLVRALRRNPAFPVRLLRVHSKCISFLKNVTALSQEEVTQYVDEINSKEEFHKHLREKLSYFNDKSFSEGPVEAPFGLILYVIVRSLKPNVMVETGVATGVSSSYILCAMEENKTGMLYSIDLPPERELPSGEQSGWAIPDWLRYRWSLTLGRSQEKLLPILEELGTIDVFLHDSEHSYQNMLWEYQTAWIYLKRGGILLSHDVGMNNAFPDFSEAIRGSSFAFKYIFTSLGGIIKT